MSESPDMGARDMAPRDMDPRDMGSQDMSPPTPAGGCSRRVAVTLDVADVDCSSDRIYCVDSAKPDAEYASIQAAVDAAQADGAAGRAVVVYGDGRDSPRDYDGFVVSGDGTGQGGGSGDTLEERFVVKALGGVRLTRRSQDSIDAPILVADVDHVTIDGFQVDRESTSGAVTSSYDHAGIRITDTDWRGARTSKGVHLYNVSVRKGSPANVYIANVSDVVVEGSHFEDSVISEQYRNGGGIHLYLSNEPVDRAIVRCNTFEGSVGMSIHTNGDGGLIEGNVYEYNVFRTSVGHAMHFQDGRDMVIRNNVYVDIDRSAVTTWGSDSEFAPRDFVIHNNLFFRTTLGRSSPSPIQIGTQGSPEDDGGHTIFNNLFVGNGQGNDITIRGDGPVALSNNVDEQGEAVTTDQTSTDPGMESLFVDYAAGDFRFAQEVHRAAVRDAGVPELGAPGGATVRVLEYDLRGERRGEDAVSIGPYEYE